MILAHKIQIIPNQTQIAYFKQASGTARFVWNWALAEWNKQYELGLKPNSNALKKQFNAIKYQQFPWLKGMHRDSHSQPFANLNKAWSSFFKDAKAGNKAHVPVFKKKGATKDSFYVASDRLKLTGKTALLPVIGVVKLTEDLRFIEAKIISATISRTANKWFLAVLVEVPDEVKPRVSDNIVGVDLGLTTLATLSTGEKIVAPKPLKAYMRRVQIRQRKVSRKHNKGVKTENYKKSVAILAKTHMRISNIRTDFCHKLTTRLCRENQTIVLEDLNVAGLMKNHKLARSLNDACFGLIRRQITYKALIYDNNLIIADRWFASSKTCNCCGYHNKDVVLGVKSWVCPVCLTVHDRDENAAKNLENLAYVKALPVANSGEVMSGKYGVVVNTAGQKFKIINNSSNMSLNIVLEAY